MSHEILLQCEKLALVCVSVRKADSGAPKCATAVRNPNGYRGARRFTAEYLPASGQKSNTGARDSPPALSRDSWDVLYAKVDDDEPDI